MCLIIPSKEGAQELNPEAAEALLLGLVAQGEAKQVGGCEKPIPLQYQGAVVVLVYADCISITSQYKTQCKY